MTLYITDNPLIKKEISGSILSYQIFNWKVSPDKNMIEDNIFNINKKFKLKEIKEKIKLHSKIIAIVSRSNYKLIFELNTLKKDITYYYWDTYKTRIEVFPNKNFINKEFFKYLQRSYLSFLIYEKITFLNLQRLEQLLIILSIIVLNKIDINKKDLNLVSFNFKTSKNSINTIDLINTISYKRNDLRYIIEKLIYHSRKNHISDPFVGKFKFIDKKNSLFKIYEKYKNENNSKTTENLIKIINLLKDIFPLVDILKTIRFMLKNELIIEKNNNLELNFEIELKDFSMLFKFLEIKTWNFIYKNRTFSDFNLFPELVFKDMHFQCPECGSTEFRSSPMHFWCSDNLCKFRVNRIISPAGIKFKISKWDLFRLLKHNSTIIKNKRGGYNRFYLLENDKTKGKYHILPYIESNNINPK